MNEADKSEKKDRNKVLQSAGSVASNSEPVPEEIQKKVTQKWKQGTVLITGDSMLTGIDEGRLQARHNVKLRPFSGASTEDMTSYLKPLMNKEPSVVILHVGTNDATENGIDSDAIVSRILSLKAEIEKSVVGCRVILSLPIRRKDNNKENKILAVVCEKMTLLKLDIINNNNIMDDHLGPRGLHFNQYGKSRFAQNLLNKLRHF